MDVKNDMESMVRQEVRRRMTDRTERRRGCWCALCEADVIALALNHLPPCYCRGANFGQAASRGFASQVRDAVNGALARVSRRPKHPPDAPDRYRREAQVVDFGLRIGTLLSATAPADTTGPCACDGCRADALALALNSYPPKYGVASQGRASYQEHYVDFIRHEIGQELARARRVVGAHPNH